MGKRRLVTGAFGLALALGFARAEAAGEASLLLGRSYVEELLLRDRTSFGGTIGVFSRIVGFELGVDYMPTSEFVVPGVELGASALNLAGNVVLQAPLGAVVPYGTVGYGGLFARAERGPGRDDFLGAFGALNYGVGAKLFFHDNVGIRFDYRRYAIQTDEDDPQLEIPLAGEVIEAEPDIDRFLVGLALRW